MKVRLKPLDQQVIVLTGGSSGIGLSTARLAAERGARLVLAARNEAALAQVTEDLRATGAEVEYVAADVSRREDVARIARAAVARFGGFDTWINDAAAATYGKLIDQPVDDMRQVFETNVWGLVHGSLEAIAHFRAKDGGGKLINIGSVLSDLAIPEQGAYLASKHAVKGFTHALRIEMRADRLPVSITLIKPSGIATPYKDHAKNLMDAPARVPAPLYAPEVVAEAILYAAQHDVRDLTVGFAGRGMALFQQFLPGVADRFYAAVGPEMQKDRRPGQEIDRRGNLYAPEADGRERTDSRFVREFSLYTAAQTHPRATAAFALAAVGAFVAGAALRSRNRVAYPPRRSLDADRQRRHRQSGA